MTALVLPFLCDRACVATKVCVEVAVLMFAHRVAALRVRLGLLQVVYLPR